MNFRNAVKIRTQENLSSYERAMLTMQNKILDYIFEKKGIKKYKKIEILFYRDKNNQKNIAAKVFLPGKHTEDFSCSVETYSFEEVKIVLLFLEQSFKNEHYKILPGTTVQVDECFSVEIDFNY